MHNRGNPTYGRALARTSTFPWRLTFSVGNVSHGICNGDFTIYDELGGEIGDR